MKIIHYIPSIDRASGGTTAYMQLLADELGKLVELHVITHPSANPVEMEGTQIHYISAIRRFRAMRRQWRELIGDIKPDVVHVNCCWYPGCALVQKWAQAMGYKVVLTPHGMLEPWIMKRHYWTRKLPALMLFQKAAIRNADCIHATAESEKENLLRLGYNGNIEVIANGIGVDDIEMKSSWKRTGNILFLSRVHVKKGINFLIEAVAKLNEECRMKKYRSAAEGKANEESAAAERMKKQRSAIDGRANRDSSISRCVIAGEGDESYINELKELAERLGISHIVDFVGGVYGERKWELFRKADVFVLPTHSENFGIVVAEALACGTPVVTTKGTPWEELEGNVNEDFIVKSEERRVKNPNVSYIEGKVKKAGQMDLQANPSVMMPRGKCGWWTEIGTEPTVKALREFILCSESQLEEMGRNGRRLVEEKYSAKTIAGQIRELYLSIRKT